VLPVLTFRELRYAVPTARALAVGGLRAIEVTLRTPAALDAIRAIAGEVPEIVVGAGSVTATDQLVAVEQAGARFAVSPGLTPGLTRAQEESEIPLLPGVSTASEAMVAREAGFTALKLFPAALLGGVRYLQALAGPLPDLRFCPTGGIDVSSFRHYLELPNVFCVGGSWLATEHDMAIGAWSEITRRAEETRS
jgi:2-dehydro-3-deoxyphosphogluconate aldolase/(4S)-4-hydroxy-2-oxoglutarate aldolase